MRLFSPFPRVRSAFISSISCLKLTSPQIRMTTVRSPHRRIVIYHPTSVPGKARSRAYLMTVGHIVMPIVTYFAAHPTIKLFVSANLTQHVLLRNRLLSFDTSRARMIIQTNNSMSRYLRELSVVRLHNSPLHLCTNGTHV